MTSNYVGQELRVFRFARNWKRYWVKALFSRVPRDIPIIEIGSGLGGNYKFLSKFSSTYLGYEPDSLLTSIAASSHGKNLFVCGRLSDVKKTSKKIVLVYADVLEHIEDDATELKNAAAILAKDSYLCILVPAHMRLYSKFDANIGHFRRYSVETISSIIPKEFDILSLRELDSIGYLLSSLAKKFSDRGKVSILQVMIWDALIPLSKILDLLNIFSGKSILVILQKR